MFCVYDCVRGVRVVLWCIFHIPNTRMNSTRISESSCKMIHDCFYKPSHINAFYARSYSLLIFFSLKWAHTKNHSQTKKLVLKIQNLLLKSITVLWNERIVWLFNVNTASVLRFYNIISFSFNRVSSIWNYLLKEWTLQVCEW